MSKVTSLEKAISVIKSGDNIGINSFFTIANPINLLEKLNERIQHKHDLKDLSVYMTAPMGNWDENFAAERFLATDAVKKIVCGHYSSMPTACRRIAANEIEGYNLPMGILSHLFRAAAQGERILFSKIGLNLFPDPSVGKYGLNDISNEVLVEKVKMRGEDFLAYKVPQLDVAIIRGTYSDVNGNISFEKEYSVVDALSMAQATKLNGGTVIVQVEKMAPGHRRPWDIVIPGMLVDMVVLCPDQESKTNPEYDSRMSGDVKPTAEQLINYVIENTKKLNSENKGRGLGAEIICKRAAQCLRPGDNVNIGIGVGEGVAFQAVQNGMLDKITLLVESGGIGGVPVGGKGFGATIGADSYLSMTQMFDFYHGGGIDKTFVGCMEVDEKGRVNAHGLKDKIVGIGGFADITQNARNIYFCTTFTSGGLEICLDEDKNLKIIKEGKNTKFVKKVQEVSFSAANCDLTKQKVYVVTERCLFKLESDGWHVLEIMRGVDLNKDILDKIPFKVHVEKDLKFIEI